MRSSGLSRGLLHGFGLSRDLGNYWVLSYPAAGVQNGLANVFLRMLKYLAVVPMRRNEVAGSVGPDNDASSTSRCNTIWYKAAFKGGVYEAREAVWAFRGAEDRRVASLEGGADVA